MRSRYLLCLSILFLVIGAYLVLPSKPPSVDVKTEMYKTKDMYGRITIQELNYSAKLMKGYSQEIVDKRDSAAIFNYEGVQCIADHNYQGLKSLGKITVNDTTCHIDKGQYIESLICTKIIKGKNTREKLVNQDGDDLDLSNVDYIIYTCDRNSQTDVIITYWKVTNTLALN